MDLFLQSSLTFEKIAFDTTMPEDPNSWSQEVLQQLFKQAPFLSDFAPQVTMDKVDAEKGYGFGYALIMPKSEVQQGADPGAMQAAGLRQVRVPIIIKDNKMAPLDLMVTDDSKVVPLTESRLRSAIFRPQAFDVTGRTPGDQSMIGQLYPPYRQNNGFGGGGVAMNVGMGKEGSFNPTPEHFKVLGLNADDAASMSKGRNKIPFNEGDRELAEILMATRLGSEWRKRGMMPAAGKKKEGMSASRCLECGKEKCGCFMGKQGSALESFLSEGSAQSLDKEAGLARLRRLAMSPDSEAMGRAAIKVNRRAVKAGDVDGYMKSRGYKDHVRKLTELADKLENKTSSVLEAIMPTANEADLDSFRRTITDYDVRLAYEKNAAATIEALQTILADRPDKAKFASVMSSVLRPTVAQIVRIDDGYSVKTASHLLWDPQTRHLSRGEAIQEFGSKIVLAADMSGATTIADGADASVPPEADVDTEKLAPIDVSGMYKVRSLDGVEMVGCVVHGLLDVNGSALPLSLFTNGSVAALQEDILGEAVEGKPVLPTATEPSGYGMFHAMLAGGLVGTIPMDVHSSWSEQGKGKKYQAVTFDGRQIQVAIQPNIVTVVSPDEQTMLIPHGWQWTPLGPSGEAALVGSSDIQEKTANAQRRLASVDVVSGGGTFSFRGPVVEKLASDQREFLDLDGAMFLMAGLGVEQQYGMRKLGQSFNGREPVQVRIGRVITTSDEQVKQAQARAAHAYSVFPSLKRQLFKEAAVVTDPEAVDAVLSIGFINPENLTAFISYMPALEAASEKLAEILMATRLGLDSIPMGAIEKSMRALEEVLEGLKALAFEEPQKY